MLKDKTDAVNKSADTAARSRDDFKSVIKICISFIPTTSFMPVSRNLTFGANLLRLQGMLSQHVGWLRLYFPIDYVHKTLRLQSLF